MAEVIRSPQAEDDLIELWRYIAADNEAAADRLLDKIDEKCRNLAAAPGIGQQRPELAPGLRCFPVGNYVIFYRPIDDGIQVVRVVSAARDVGGIFFDV